MYSTHLRVGKTFAAEQKIRELKKGLIFKVYFQLPCETAYAYKDK